MLPRQKFTRLFPKRAMLTAYKEKAIDYRMQIAAFISLHSKYTQKKRRNERKIKVHSCWRLKRKTRHPTYNRSLEPYLSQCLSMLLFLTLEPWISQFIRIQEINKGFLNLKMLDFTDFSDGQTTMSQTLLRINPWKLILT